MYSTWIIHSDMVLNTTNQKEMEAIWLNCNLTFRYGENFCKAFAKALCKNCEKIKLK